jgi:hypothetical protein
MRFCGPLPIIQQFIFQLFQPLPTFSFICIIIMRHGIKCACYDVTLSQDVCPSHGNAGHGD